MASHATTSNAAPASPTAQATLIPMRIGSYYAMYDAAHAALLAENRIDYKITKTHSGLIAAFGLHIVATKKLTRELGRSLNEVEQIRLLADYTGEEINLE